VAARQARVATRAGASRTATEQLKAATNGTVSTISSAASDQDAASGAVSSAVRARRDANVATKPSGGLARRDGDGPRLAIR
jgi:hypothetical protein